MHYLSCQINERQVVYGQHKTEQIKQELIVTTIYENIQARLEPVDHGWNIANLTLLLLYFRTGYIMNCTRLDTIRSFPWKKKSLPCMDLNRHPAISCLPDQSTSTIWSWWWVLWSLATECPPWRRYEWDACSPSVGTHTLCCCSGSCWEWHWDTSPPWQKTRPLLCNLRRENHHEWNQYSSGIHLSIKILTW